MPEIVVVAAVAEAPGTPSDRLIGDGYKLPWHLPDDLRRFKAMTLGHPLVMGRKTFESLLVQFGGPLPGRENVVLTRHPTAVDHPGIHVYGGLAEAVGAFGDRERVFIGGGAGVYGAVLSGDGPVQADRLELTMVEGEFSGDTFFPPYRHLLAGPATPPGTASASGAAPFRQQASERHPARDGRPAFRFETWVRA